MTPFKYNQDDLDLMSRERELVTDELHTPNDFYGQAHLIKKYSNYHRPLKVVFEHSLPPHEIIWNPDKQCILPIALVSSNHRANVFRKQKAKRFVFNVGSILNYVILDSDPEFAKNGFKSNTPRTGSIYFPSHSTHHVKSNSDSDKIISQIQSLPPVYHPVTVCLYWKDIQDGKHLNYLKNGIQVVSAGHIYDNLFYYRLYDILKNFKYTLGSAFGSFIFHASRAGSIVVYPKELENITDAYEISSQNFADKDLIGRLTYQKEFDKITANMFKERVDQYSEEQIKFIEHYCSARILSPAKIKAILLFAEPVYFIERILIKAKKLIKKQAN